MHLKQYATRGHEMLRPLYFNEAHKVFFFKFFLVLLTINFEITLRGGLPELRKLATGVEPMKSFKGTAPTLRSPYSST